MNETKERSNIASEVYEHIKKMILAGEISSGQRVPEERISQLFNVSRTPIREALRRLEAYGLVYVKPRSFAEVIMLDDKEIEKVAAVRAKLECFAVEVLTGQISDEDCRVLSDMEAACMAAFHAGNVADVFEKDSLLHLEIAKRTQNRYLYEMIERLDAKVQLYRISKCINYKKIEHDICQHKAIVEAICGARTEQAVAYMGEHVCGFLSNKTIV